jgi:cell division protein FtsQ
VSGAAATLRSRLSVRALAGSGAAAISPRLRRRLLLAAALCLVLAAGYQFWLRDSSFVAVEKVTVTGLTSTDSERVRVALTSAGRSMTTLHVDQAALERAVEGYPVVRELEVSSDFPHGLRVHVVEHHPAAIAVGDAGRVPVASDGTILRGMPVEGRLPTVEVDGAFGTERLQHGAARAAAAVAGMAPAALRARLSDVERRGDDGLVASLREGPELIFGDARRLRAKWAAAARVLADLEARGASYIDLRIPGRPAAGGLPAETVAPVAPAGDPTTVDPGGAATGVAGATGAAGQPAVPQPTDPALASPAPVTPATGTTPTTPEAPAAQPVAPVPVAPVTGGAGGGATAAPQP